MNQDLKKILEELRGEIRDKNSQIVSLKEENLGLLADLETQQELHNHFRKETEGECLSEVNRYEMDIFFKNNS